MSLSFDPFSFAKRQTAPVTINHITLGGDNPARVFADQQITPLGDVTPELIYQQAGAVEVDLNDDTQFEVLNLLETPVLVTVKDGTALNPVTAGRLLAAKLHPRHPILLKDTFTPDLAPAEPLLSASVNLMALLCDGIGDAVLIRGDRDPAAAARLSFNILQAAGNRVFKTEYVTCPSCGRTLFNLQTTTAKVKAATMHLKGVKIAVMGCIVNGPGEMADADFGYVGGAPGKINLYVGKQPVKFNIPEEEAVDRLVDLIRERGKWVEN